ncbi:hypothetical protein BaRGS_00030714 [Batillaria attramentaria]|uniref:Uncharacterized protein n=1 Tax=Batillaria attramentaria TaxID=370345 RepID=A0ABD0JT44_9CAEN
MASGCVLVALVFQLVGIAGTGWLVSDPGGYGLFRVCAEGVCVRYGDEGLVAPDWLKAVQGFSIIGLLTILAVATLVVLHYVKENAAQYTIVAAIISGVSGLVILIEFAIYVAKSKDLLGNGVSLGYGFILTVIACVDCFVAAVFLFLAKNASG